MTAFLLPVLTTEYGCFRWFCPITNKIRCRHSTTLQEISMSPVEDGRNIKAVWGFTGATARNFITNFLGAVIESEEQVNFCDDRRWRAIKQKVCFLKQGNNYAQISGSERCHLNKKVESWMSEPKHLCRFTNGSRFHILKRERTTRTGVREFEKRIIVKSFECEAKRMF